MNETVKLPRVLVNSIRGSEWFKYYNDFEDFVLEAVRIHSQKWRRTEQR